MEEKHKKEEVILTFVKEQNLNAFVDALTEIALTENIESNGCYAIRANKSAHIEIVRKHND